MLWKRAGTEKDASNPFKGNVILIVSFHWQGITSSFHWMRQSTKWVWEMLWVLHDDSTESEHHVKTIWNLIRPCEIFGFFLNWSCNSVKWTFSRSRGSKTMRRGNKRLFLCQLTRNAWRIDSRADIYLLLHMKNSTLMSAEYETLDSILIFEKYNSMRNNC